VCRKWLGVKWRRDTPLSGETGEKFAAAAFEAIGMHNNAACRHTRTFLQLYNTLKTKEQIPGSKGLAPLPVKNISVLTGLRLKANQTQKENRFPIELSAMPHFS